MIYAIRVLCPECGADHKAEVDVEILTVQGGEQTEHRLVVKGERDVGAEAARWTAEAAAWTTEAAGRSAGAAERMWQTEHLRELLERENANPTP